MKDLPNPQSIEIAYQLNATSAGNGRQDNSTVKIIIRMDGFRIGRKTAISLTVCFALLMAFPIAQELFVNPHPSLIGRFSDDLKKYGVQLAFQEVEKHLVYDSQFATLVRQPYQRLLSRTMDQGSRSVLIGNDGFLFHRNDVAGTTGLGILSKQFLNESPAGTDVVNELIKRIRNLWKSKNPELPAANPALQPIDSLTALSDFHEKLSRRGIHFLVVIVPTKSTIYPEKLWPEYPSSVGPAWNVDYPKWREHLIGKGVDVLDLSERFWNAKDEDREPFFLKQDTHWSPRGVAVGAEAVAEHVRGRLRKESPLRFTLSKQTIPEPNDLVVLLGLRPDNFLFRQPALELTQVVSTNNDATVSGDMAPVLLFGDSLTGYYDGDYNSKLGNNAGFCRQLMLRLNVGVQSVVGFGGESNLAIQNALARKPSILANKKVVILEFSMAALYSKRFSTLFTVP